MTEGTNNTAPDTSEPEEFLSVEQAAERVGLTGKFRARVLRALTVWGDGPDAITVGGRTLYASRALDDWMGDGYGTRAEVRALAHFMLGSIRPERADDGIKPTPTNGNPARCAPWCQYGDGHTNVNYVEDQLCYGAPLRVELSLHDKLPAGDVADDGDMPSPDFVEVFASQGPVQPSEVVMMRNDEIEARFTPDEARQFIEALQLVLGQVAA